MTNLSWSDGPSLAEEGNAAPYGQPAARGWQLAAILRDGGDITDEPMAFSAGEQVDVPIRFAQGSERLGRPACDPR